jgi:hypothetical protein
MIIPLARVVVQKFPLSVRQLRPGELPEQNRAGIMDFQGFLEAESRMESGRRRTLGESRIQLAIARNANHQPARMRLVSRQLAWGEVGDTAGKKRTRPLAQYTANGLASPGH